MKKKENQTKVKLKCEKIVSAYNILTVPKAMNKEGAIREGFKISCLETPDLFKVIRICKIFKPVATSLEDFRKDARERLKPDKWDEITKKAEKWDELSQEERREINDFDAEYTDLVNECVQTELDVEKEIDSYERISKDGFGKLVKANEHILDTQSILLLSELLVEQ